MKFPHIDSEKFKDKLILYITNQYLLFDPQTLKDILKYLNTYQP